MPRHRLLIVEDHRATAAALRGFLQVHGYEIEVAETMRSGIAAATSAQYDLLVCDLGLPDGDGWELLKQVRATSQVPALAFSAYDEPVHVERSRAAGFAEHVVKTGTDPDMLLAIIERTLSSPGAAADTPAATR